MPSELSERHRLVQHNEMTSMIQRLTYWRQEDQARNQLRFNYKSSWRLSQCWVRKSRRMSREDGAARRQRISTRGRHIGTAALATVSVRLGRLPAHRLIAELAARRRRKRVHEMTSLPRDFAHFRELGHEKVDHFW